MSLTPFTPLPDYTPSAFAKVPNDLFLETTIGKPQNLSPLDAFVTLYRVNQVCKELNSKVHYFVFHFIHHSGKFQEFTAKFPNIDFKNPCPESLKNAWNFVIRDLMVLNPKITYTLLQEHENILQSCDKECIINNHLGAPELCAIDNLRENIIRVDLTTQNYSILKLKTELEPVSSPLDNYIYNNKNWIATSGKWVALCTKGCSQITVIDSITGSWCHAICGLVNIIQFRFEGKYLYVLGEDDQPGTVFHQYDSENWNALPKQLRLENFVTGFYLGKDEVLFAGWKRIYIDVDEIGYSSVRKCQLYLLKREDCFLNSNPIFYETSPEQECPLINVIDKEFLTLTTECDGDSYYAILKSICLENSSIIEKQLQKFPIDDSLPIRDFHVLFDKLIMHKVTDYYFRTENTAVSFFNLTDGRHIKDFDSELNNYELDIAPQIAFLPNKNIVIVQKTTDPETNYPATGMMTLNFRMGTSSLFAKLPDELFFKTVSEDPQNGMLLNHL